MQTFVYLETFYAGSNMYFVFKSLMWYNIDYTMYYCGDVDNPQHFTVLTNTRNDAILPCATICFNDQCESISVLGQRPDAPLTLTEDADMFYMAYDFSNYELRLTVCRYNHADYVESVSECTVFKNESYFAKGPYAYFFEMIRMLDGNIVYTHNVSIQKIQFEELDYTNLTTIGYPYPYYGTQSVLLPEYAFAARCVSAGELLDGLDDKTRLMLSSECEAALTGDQTLVPDSAEVFVHDEWNYVVISNLALNDKILVPKARSTLVINNRVVTQHITPVCNATVTYTTGSTVIKHQIVDGNVTDALASTLGLMKACVQFLAAEKGKPRKFSFFYLAAQARPAFYWYVIVAACVFLLIEGSVFGIVFGRRCHKAKAEKTSNEMPFSSVSNASQLMLVSPSAAQAIGVQ